jgi:hypothetical protein
MIMDILARASERLGLRRHVRLPCQVVREHDFSLLGDRCLDMSPRGMRVRALSPVERGTEVLVSFRVPDAGIHMDLSAVVTRVAEGRRRGERFPSFGLSFEGISALEGMILTARLKGIPPPVPTRHLRIDYAAGVRAVHASLYC